MAENSFKWTQQQLRAITARGSDVMVAASAGTGKTAVLSGRCADIVSDKGVCPDVWSILVLTFTEAAAEQMRSRIAQQLRAALLESGDPHLRHQLILLQGADISTIHSFCKRLITAYFYKLGLDPTFRAIDDDEAKLLKAEALESTIDWAWRQSHLTQGLQQLFCRRDLRTNDGFLAKVIALGDFLDGVVARTIWYERATVLADAVDPFATELGQKQKQIVGDKLRAILNQLRHARTLCENENAGSNWTVYSEQTFIKPVEQCLKLLEAGDWDRCSEQIRNFKKPRVYKPKELADATAELIRKTVKGAVDCFEALSKLAVINPQYLDMVRAPAGLQTKVFVELVKKFDQFYDQAKRTINSLDFADLEHHALRLLTEEENREPSETALALRRKYKYIFVDEYQDINDVQEAILSALSPGGNVFGVGDVKQSIYAWRGAKPEIFLEHLRPASVDPAEAARGLRVDLNANFRSAKGILDFVNKLFGRIMTGSFTKITYDESAQLRPAGQYESRGPSPRSDSRLVEIHLLDEQAKEQDSQNSQTDESFADKNLNVISSRQRQAALIAQRIKQMVSAQSGKAEFQIYDKQHDKLRDVQYRDIVILMRSLAKKANDYVDVLRLAGVPVSCQATAGYFEATEISDMLCLLKVLDNPLRDIEFAAVLRSPLFKVTDTDLAKIKIHGKTQQNRNFHDCVVEYAGGGPDARLADRLRVILAGLGRWRTLARRGELADLIWRIYRETSYLSFVSALPSGQARRANLLKLHDRAIQFEGFASSGPVPSLTRFVEFVEKLQEAGQDWAPAEPDSSAENAVRIISVHKSKGLEFPVVFLAELNTRFNKRDIYEDCLADADFTLGLQIVDRPSNVKLSSLAHQVIAEQKLATMLAEEMRILYVAATRARDRLILTASQRQQHCHEIICDGFLSGAKTIGDWQLRRCQSPLEWVLYGLCDQKSLHVTFETGLGGRAVDDNLFELRLYSQGDLGRLAGYILKQKSDKSRGPKLSARKSRRKQTQPGLLAQVKKSLTWQYRFGDAPVVSAKSSVSRLTHHNDEYAAIDYSGALSRQPVAVVARGQDLGGQVESRLIGTATHLVLAQLDLAKPVTAEAVEKTKERLVADGAIPEGIAEHIGTKGIVTFFQSEVGRMVLDGENEVWREWPFTFAIPATEWEGTAGLGSPKRHFSHFETPLEIAGGENESIIVQGIIDMLVWTPAGLLIIDFKTDNIAAAGVVARAELYREQLELYGRAAGAILKAETVSRWLYFLTPGYAIDV